jgi:hypothetical protein
MNSAFVLDLLSSLQHEPLKISVEQAARIAREQV